MQFPFCAFHHHEEELKCIYTGSDSSNDLTHSNTQNPHLHNSSTDVCFVCSAHLIKIFSVEKNNFSIEKTSALFIAKLIFNTPEKEYQNTLKARAPPTIV